MKKLQPHTKRLCAAIFLIIVCIAIIPVVQIVIDTAQISRALDKDDSAESWSFEKDVCDLKELEISSYSEECDGKVIGFNMAENASSAFRKVTNCLSWSDWRQISSGSETISTFVKDGGTYTWLLLQATDVGTGSCITITLN